MTPGWLLERVRAIPDPALRRRTLARLLSAADPKAAAAAADELLDSATRSGDDYDLAVGLTSLVQALGELDYAARQALYEAARSRGAEALARLLLDASPAVVDADETTRQLRPERPLRPRGRPLTLGERKALARSSGREPLGQLVRDPHPDVVAVLLDNPRLTEAEVVSMAAARSALPESLVRIAEHRRWSVRQGVRRALVLNPRTPVHLALRISTVLGPTDWRDVARDPQLPESLRHHTRELLRARG